jgi:hypothetical protein
VELGQPLPRPTRRPRHGRDRVQQWLGLYHEVHLGVDGDRARIITAVEATPGAVADEGSAGPADR